MHISLQDRSTLNPLIVMRILGIHNNYQIRGGEEESRDSEEALLRSRGHIVNVYEDNNSRISELNPVQVGLKTIWSREAYAAVKQRLSQQQYDVVHVQNFFPLISPSIYYAAKNAGVPVVQSLRNYRLVCPNALFFRDSQVCEDCLGKAVPWPGVVHGCYRKSRGATAATASMLVAHRAIGTWQHHVDAYIALTQFAKEKLTQGGLPAEKMIVKPNFVRQDPGVGSGQGGYALYVGRLSVEKGLDTLLDAWEQLAQPLPLKIVGAGPLEGMVKSAAARMPHVEWLGRQPVAEVYRLMGEAMFLVFPSKWYETFGRVAVEAFAKGTPVIAAEIGAIAELIVDRQTGRFFQPGNAVDLAAKVNWAIAHPEALAALRLNVRREFETKYTAERNYHQLVAIYNQVMAQPIAAEPRANSATLASVRQGLNVR